MWNNWKEENNGFKLIFEKCFIFYFDKFILYLNIEIEYFEVVMFNCFLVIRKSVNVIISGCERI